MKWEEVSCSLWEKLENISITTTKGAHILLWLPSNFCSHRHFPYKIFAHWIPCWCLLPRPGLKGGTAVLLETLRTIRWKTIFTCAWKTGHITEIGKFSGKKKKLKKKHCEYPSLHQTKPSGFETIVKCHQQFAFQWEQRMSTPSQREKPIRSGTEWWDRSLGEGKENGGCILCIQAFTIITSVPLSKKSEVYWFPISWY